jgi:hypothetical protein
MAKWYYRIRNEEHGPVPDLGLAALLADGTLGPTDEVRMDGEFEWRPASAALSFHAAQASTDSWSAGELDDLLGEETPVIHARRRERNVAEGQEPPADPMTAGADDLDSLLGEEAPVIAPRAKPAAAPVVAEASPGEPAWYYKSLGQEIGPVPYSEITRLAQEGELHPNDFVRPGEAGAWQRAGRITGLFPDNYEATQAQLREAAAKVSLSSQRFGEKGMAALEAEIANPTPKDEDDEPEPPPQKPAKSKKKKKSREKIKDVDEFAAAVLAEEVEEETPPPRTRSEAPAEPRQPARTADPAYAETRPMTSSPTPMPPTRSYTPPPPPAVAGFKRGPQSKSSGGGGGFSLPFDAQKAGIAAAVVLVLAGGYFIPWGKVLKSGDGPAPEIYHRAVFMWGKIRVLRDDKKAKQPDWEMLESELVTNINLQIAELKPYSTELATNLVKFEESMKEILAQGKSHPPELYKDAEGYLDKAKAALPKK